VDTVADHGCPVNGLQSRVFQESFGNTGTGTSALLLVGRAGTLAAMHYDAVRQMTFLIDYQGTLRKFFTIGFTRTDGSLYIFPYARSSTYYFGSTVMPKHEQEHTFNFKMGREVSVMPKISIHESGQVHVGASGYRAGPLYIPRLEDIRGSHIATVTADHFDALPVYTGKPKHTRKAQAILGVDPGVSSGRMPVYLWTRDSDSVDCPVRARLRRASLSAPLIVGFRVRSQEPLHNSDAPGVTVIAGWDPTASPDGSERPFLYVRGQ
jgi:hypothetical protein